MVPEDVDGADVDQFRMRQSASLNCTEGSQMDGDHLLAMQKVEGSSPFIRSS
jgi:hypothetical protein